MHYVRLGFLFLILPSCQLGYFNPPVHSIEPEAPSRTSHQETIDTISTVANEEDTISLPDFPYEVYTNSSGVYKIKAYIGYDWSTAYGKNSFWPRNDGDITKAGSILEFPAQGGAVLFEIVNAYADFSLYITNYNKHIASEVYYFDESNGYPGVLSFSEYGTYYYSITYRLVVKPNSSTSPISCFCQAHWASNKERSYLSDLHIQCKQLGSQDNSSFQVQLIDI